MGVYHHRLTVAKATLASVTKYSIIFSLPNWNKKHNVKAQIHNNLGILRRVTLLLCYELYLATFMYQKKQATLKGKLFLVVTTSGLLPSSVTRYLTTSKLFLAEA